MSAVGSEQVERRPLRHEEEPGKELRPFDMEMAVGERRVPTERMVNPLLVAA